MTEPQTSLQELTGHEAGAVQYRDGSIMVLNWAGIEGIPRILGPLAPIGMGEELGEATSCEAPEAVRLAMIEHDREKGGEETYTDVGWSAWELPNHDVTVVVHQSWN